MHARKHFLCCSQHEEVLGIGVSGQQVTADARSCDMRKRNARKGVHKRPHSLARWVGGFCCLADAGSLAWVGGNRASMHSHFVNPRHKSSIVRQCCCQLGGNQAHRQRVAQRASTQNHKYVPGWPCRLHAQESARGGCDESRMSSYTLANELHTCRRFQGCLAKLLMTQASAIANTHTHMPRNPTGMVKRNLQPTSQKSACPNRRVGHWGAGGEQRICRLHLHARVHGFQHSTSRARGGRWLGVPLTTSGSLPNTPPTTQKNAMRSNPAVDTLRCSAVWWGWIGWGVCVMS
jgi:hypothetical protein